EQLDVDGLADGQRVAGLEDGCSGGSGCDVDVLVAEQALHAEEGPGVASDLVAHAFIDGERDVQVGIRSTLLDGDEVDALYLSDALAGEGHRRTLPQAECAGHERVQLVAAREHIEDA